MDNLITLNQHRWDICKVNTDKLAAFKSVADKLTTSAAKARYQSVSNKTKVPWWFIAAVHYREADMNWNANLAQGDPWNKKSTHVPANRGPFKSWEDAAYDALVNCPPYAARNTDWSPGGALTMLEKFNGLGYYRKGLASPYVWAGTDQYSRGKYVSDGVYSATTVDTQLGVAGILKAMGVFNKGVGTSAGAAGAIVVAGGAAVASTPHHYWPWIIGGTIAAALIAFISFEAYEFNTKGT
jgi:lysozyme family protein